MSSEPELSRAAHAPLTLERKFTLLADRRRRTLLFVVGDASGPVPLTDLSERLLARESTDSAADSAAVERIELKLHHVDLPKLADADVVAYDPETRTVSRGRRFEDVHSWLELVDVR